MFTTKLRPGIINDAELFDSQFTVYCSDRDYIKVGVERGRGSLIAVRSGISVNVFSYSVDDTTDNKIVGGRYIGIEEVPFQAFVLTDKNTCGGVIYDEEYIVTAAHLSKELK
ncbi:unnamed protein product [Leptidea sinapis]|uniref:Peptidase S1 domain-containing protein n=1 Tax=Leptidea sinapis TaxID=189913 RepID=A0A5E4QYM3_9NEOP|nr:unnamed protein product [Leptidea sinapis]